MKKINFILTTSMIFALLTGACISKTDKEPVSKKSEITIENSWARPSKAGMMSAAYFTLKNTTSTPDTLVSISSDVFKNLQIHESYETEDGLMGMREQAFIALPSQSTMEFKQGGFHVMIIQPEIDLAQGDSISLTLNFSSSKEIEAKFPIRISN